MRHKQKLLFIVLLVISLVIFFVIRQYNKPHIDVFNSTPDIVTNSHVLLDEFQKNESLANSKYLDKIVQINGRISKIEASENNDIIVTLINDISTLGTVICHLSSKENKKLNNLKEGQNVVIKGICTGYLMDVILIRCSLVKI
jgi:preprotein translocase subunit YajC